MKVKALVIGGATLDTIIEYEKMESIEIQKSSKRQAYLLLEEGAKIEVSKQKCFSGGGATNAAVSLRKLGIDVRFFGKVGNDSIGQLLLGELNKQGIDISQVKFSDHFGTATSYVVPSLNGDRTIFTYRGANRDLLTEKLPLEAIRQADFLYITSLSKISAVQLRKVVEFAKISNTKVVVNPGNRQLEVGRGFIKDSLFGIDILILNYREAQELMLSLLTYEKEQISSDTESFPESRPFYKNIPFSLRDFFQKILSLGPRIVLVSEGKNGVYIGTKKELSFHPALKTNNIVNTLGAGDAFGSSFAGAIYSGETIEIAVSYGLINSSSVIQYSDAKSGLLEKDDLLKKIDKIHTPLQNIGW
jgi:sugar/nucleoside kinase (ribokinase family)